MGLGKQAKILTKAQQEAVMQFIASTRNPVRNRVVFLLSVKAGLRAKEVASLTWAMVTDSSGQIGDCIRLENKASKGKSGRVIPLNRELRKALLELQQATTKAGPDDGLLTTERRNAPSPAVIVNLLTSWYHRLGFVGCSSHSGRRTFITMAARRISSVGGSLRDVQMLAGHSALTTTQRYIEAEADAQRKVIELV